MADALPAPQHIELSPPDKPGPYANLYRFGIDSRVLRVVYVGGAVSRATYEERRHTAPTMIAASFARARARVTTAPVELLCCPCPLDTGEHGTEWILEHHQDIESVLGSAEEIAAVGYSAGASYATTLALFEDRARALAVFGAAGMAATIDELRPVIAQRRSPPLPCAAFSNTGDPVCAQGDAWARRHPEALAATVRRAPGGHPFADYEANGSVVAAFAFVLEHLCSTARR